MFFSILVCCFLVKTAFEYIAQTNVQNLYINMFLYTSDLYDNVRLKINCIRHYFTLHHNQGEVNCIKDGRSTNYTISEFQKIKNGWACLYDFCLLNIPNKTYKCEKYRYNVVRLCPKKTYTDEHIGIGIGIGIEIASKVEFMDVRIVYKENMYKLNFGERNFYMVNNILFDAPFIQWCMREYHKIQMAKDDSYECIILDNNVKSISLKNNSHIIINIDDYTLLNNNII